MTKHIKTFAFFLFAAAPRAAFGQDGLSDDTVDFLKVALGVAGAITVFLGVWLAILWIKGKRNSVVEEKGQSILKTTTIQNSGNLSPGHPMQTRDLSTDDRLVMPTIPQLEEYARDHSTWKGIPIVDSTRDGRKFNATVRLRNGMDPIVFYDDLPNEPAGTTWTKRREYAAEHWFEKA